MTPNTTATPPDQLDHEEPLKEDDKIQAQKQVTGKNFTGVYRYVGLGSWLLISAFMVLDRFYWNVWPRQTICTNGCGGDFFCDMEDDPGCLKAGPWSVKTFDVISRISARLIISTTNLMFITMCHGTFNYLSEVQMLRPFLYSWRADNFWLHAIGGWTIGAWTLVHVWSLFLPSMFHGFKNVVVGGYINLPLQMPLGKSQIDIENDIANWGYDDIWRITWMTIMFCVLMPLSRSAWALKANFSLAMWLHIEPPNRDTPSRRVDHHAKTTRITLDEDYLLLLWHEQHPKRICDIFWLKHGDRDSKGTRRTGEMAHPFTTCSSHDMPVTDTSEETPSQQVRPAIEIPLDTSVHWKGHRFVLTSGIVQRSNALESTRRTARAFYGTGDLLVSMKGDEILVQANEGESLLGRGPTMKWPTSYLESMFGGTSSSLGGSSVLKQGHNPTYKLQPARTKDGMDAGSIFGEDDEEEVKEATMVGVDVSSDGGEVAVVVGELRAGTQHLGDHSLVRDAVQNFFSASQDLTTTTTRNSPSINSNSNSNSNSGASESESDHPEYKVDEQGRGDGEPSDQDQRVVIKRLGTDNFHRFRKVEAEEGRVGVIAAGSWSKMAIVRISRRASKARVCSCMGLTFVLDIFRGPETSIIADLEAVDVADTVPLRAYGPYRSEYGRLGEFPNLPPLLVVATGAGAALVLDFVGFVRANKMVPLRPVTVCYSSASLALLQFVTNTLLAERIPGIRIQTALTRHEDLEVFDTTSNAKGELVSGRLDIKVSGMMPRLVDVASSAARGLISRGVEGYSKLRGSNDFGLDPALGSPTAVLLLLLALVLYMVYRRLYCQTFGGLDALSVGGGKQGDSWLKSQSDVEVTWLGQRELKVLQACGDTLLPGFVIGHKEAANAAVGQTVAMVRSNMFPGKKAWAERRTGRANVNISRDLTCSNKRQEPNPLPPLLEAYVRALGRRCLEMQGRPGSDIGVAVLFAQAFETNISAEQRSGLRTLFWALSTRAGAFLLTGRAVPFHAQSLAARHAVLKRWSTSRTGKFREAFQGVKRLTCSLYFTAHPEVSPSKPKLAGKSAEAAAEADIKTNPNWVDIRYDPQHHRLAHNGNPNGNPAVSLSPSVHAAAAAKPWLWSGAKKGKVAQTGRAAAAAASSPTRVLSTNSNSSSNPPSPATSSAPPLFSAKATAATPSTASSRTPKIFFRSNSKSSAGAGSTLPTDFAEDDDPGSGASAGAGAGAGTCAPQPLPRELQVDVVVVGSGAGGGCAAGALAARGLKVAVLEKGGLFGAKDFAGFSEMEAYQKMYEGQGVLASDDAGVVILAGSCVGGGTTVNWAASFRTPRHVRLEWARKLGLKSFELDGPYDEALDAVCERLGVNTEHSHRAKGCPVPRGSLRVNQHQSSLWNGAVASGHVPRPVPRNAQGCVDCGSCLHGCAFGSKRSTHVTWLQDGLDSGNVILIPNAKVDKVLVDAGRAIGVEATVNPPDGQRDGAGEKGGAVPLTVRARAVVVSGGAINTPAILLRSGLKHPMIGRHLCLHPALV
eukprot:g14954.t1